MFLSYVGMTKHNRCRKDH